MLGGGVDEAVGCPPRAPTRSSLVVCAHRPADRPTHRLQGGPQQDARHRSASAASPNSSATALTAASASRARPAEPDQGGVHLRLPASRRLPPAAVAGRRHHRRHRWPGAPSLSFSSRTSRWAPFLPMPGHLRQRSDVLGAPRSAAARPDAGLASIACASRGPTPLTVCSDLEDRALVGVGEAVEREGVLAHHQRGVHRRLLAASEAGRASPACTGSARPSPPTSITATFGSDVDHRAADRGDHRGVPAQRQCGVQRLA